MFKVLSFDPQISLVGNISKKYLTTYLWWCLMEYFFNKKSDKVNIQKSKLVKSNMAILKMDYCANVENDNLDYVWYEKIFVTFLRDDKGKKTISLVKLLLFLTRFKSSSLFKYPILHTFFNHRENSQLLNRKEYARQVLSPVLSWHLQFPDLYSQLFNSLSWQWKRSP